MIILLKWQVDKFPLTSFAVKAGIPSNDELEKLSRQLGNDWESLGRRLGYIDEGLTAFRRDKDGMFDATRRMLIDWKKTKGSDATYQVLHDALTHEFVGCKLLAEEFCCSNWLRRKLP